MASPVHRLLYILAAVILLSIIPTNAARPCKTVVFTSATFNQNPNFHLQNPRFLNLYVVGGSREFNPNRFLSYKWNRFLAYRGSRLAGHVVKQSMRERTLDIMSIVGALLFGFGSGAVTAAIMCLIWSLFSPRQFGFNADSDDDDEFDFSRKKMGYVALPVDTGAKQVD